MTGPSPTIIQTGTARVVSMMAGMVVLASFMTFPCDGQSAESDRTGLKVGTKAPDFTLKNQDGKEVSLLDLRKKGPLAIVFHRSADW